MLFFIPGRIMGLGIHELGLVGLLYSTLLLRENVCGIEESQGAIMYRTSKNEGFHR
jgi:hypothetical protein